MSNPLHCLACALDVAAPVHTCPSCGGQDWRAAAPAADPDAPPAAPPTAPSQPDPSRRHGRGNR